LTLTEDLSDGVKHIVLTHFLQENEKKSTDLFTRTCQRELWNEVLSYLEFREDSHAIVTGNPGIGKSRSMAYMLRLLLSKGKTVIYETRKDTTAFAFIPQEDGKYKVWSCGEFKPSSCTALMNPNNYYLIDPDLPQQIVNVSAHTILSVSPNRQHFKEFNKRSNTLKWIMPIWKKEELKSLQKYFKMTDNEFETRYMNFGGRIRFIFSGVEEYSKSFDEIKESISRLDLDKLIKALSPDGIDIDQSEQSGPSIVFIYNVLAVPTIFNSITYKYLKIQGNYMISIASETICHLIACKYWKEIMDILNPKSQRYSQNATLNGRLFELVSSVFLEFSVEFDVKDDKNMIDHKLILSQGKRVEYGGTWDNFLLYCSNLKLSTNTTFSREVVIPKTINQPVIDIMDARDRGYQITVGKEHGISKSNIQNMLKKLNITSQNPLNLYFVVLECRFDEFQWKYEGDFILDPEVIALEKKTVQNLKKDLNNVGEETTGLKEDLIKRILQYKQINTETSKDIMDKIQNCLKIYKICIPKDPPSIIEDMIKRLHQK